MAAQRPDEGCSRERRRLTPLEHPSSVSALRAHPPSPTRGEGKNYAHSPARCRAKRYTPVCAAM
ncbi:hypothetical protein EOA25_08165 [Mesorhizobium sp. M2A.F.Ca.ET.040.01.1.1]|nr:hypothetical protein EOA25_08165 [Mesorhizobium sp. M2A.F.Ca.ET.040.01.1.1]